MALSFERGSPDGPQGHAIVYFRVLGEREKLLATYVVALPFTMDFTRYLPPMLAAHMGPLPQTELSAFAMPPVPDEVGTYEELQRLAELRDDDLIYGGTLPSRDVVGVMQMVNDAVAEYSRLWSEHARAARQAPAAQPGLRVDEVLYSLMAERDKLGELAKLLGRLRFAVEGRDQRAAGEAVEDIRTLARYLPERYQVERLLAAAQTPTPQGARLAQLYLERAYALCDEQFERVQELEGRIAELERGP
mgnify:CR=1 FL=1